MPNPWIALLIALWCLTLLVGLLLFGLLRQVGLIHRQIEALTVSHVSPPEGLEVGAIAPSFTLDKVGGGRISLEEFREYSLLLAFVSPSCGPCKSFLPELNKVSTHLQHQTLVVSMGSLEENERLRETLGLKMPLAVQRGMETANLYKIRATPYVYAIDEHGVIRDGKVANTAHQLEEMLHPLQRKEGFKRKIVLDVSANV